MFNTVLCRNQQYYGGGHTVSAILFGWGMYMYICVFTRKVSDSFLLPLPFHIRCKYIYESIPKQLTSDFLFLLVSAPSITSSIRLRGFTGLFTHKNDGFWSAFRVSLRFFNRRNFGASKATIINRRTNWIIFKINYLHKMWLC